MKQSILANTGGRPGVVYAGFWVVHKDEIKN